MKVLIGCDVDPVLPPLLCRRPAGDVWAPLDRVPQLVDQLGDELPPITWLIRADETIRYATGDYASGYSSRRGLWSELQHRGHELGWHMHLLSFRDGVGAFVFDPRPGWIAAAHEALARQVSLRATRTGWDYGSNFLFLELERLGIELDFSALPGNRVWGHTGPVTFVVDWLRCRPGAYRPSRSDYQRPGADALRMCELPLAQFRNSASGALKRLVWRLRHGCMAVRGLRHKTRVITEPWRDLPFTDRGIWAFHFHPDELTADGIRAFADNVALLRRGADAEFVTASEAASVCAIEDRGT